MDIANLSGSRSFPIYNADGSAFNNLVLRKATYESTVMSLGDKITGETYYINNTLQVTMKEYIEYEGTHYVLVNPPTILREGHVSDNSELKGMTKYSFTFYHPMYKLSSIPFTDVAVANQTDRYLSHDHTFYWIGNLTDFVAKLDANLKDTEWTVMLTTNGNADTIAKAAKMSDVMQFDKKMVSDALKDAFDTWEIPFVIEPVVVGQTGYDQGKCFLIRFGVPSNEIYDGQSTPYIFRFGQGVGLKNNSRNPKNNKIVTRIIGIGSENNIPYGYPQIEWMGDQTATTTSNGYTIYDGIVGGQRKRLIKHPFTRTHLMPSIYVETVNRKVNEYATGYDPTTTIIDYYDATAGTYPNPINPDAPSAEIHEFSDIKPRLGEKALVGVQPYEEPTEMGDIGNFKYTTLADLLTFIQTSAANTSDENERAALQALYTALSAPTITDYYDGHLGGAYTYRAVVVIRAGYIYVEYTSDQTFFRFYTPEPGQTPSEDPVDWDDTMDEEGKYKQSYFKVTLPVLDFDIYAMASITEEMQINMKSGACLGCTFTIQVDWDDYKKNFYNADGQFDPVIHTTDGDGHVRDGEKYPDSSQGQITVIVQKDLNTFGTIMPNTYQTVAAGDQFVILGISLPTSYITNAQNELDEAMRQYMLENNVYYYDYPLKFDEYFLTNHSNILEQIRNNSIVRFAFGSNNSMALYVKQIVIKWQDTPLPTYDITLTDDIEIVLNQIGQVTDDVSRLRLQLSELQNYYNGANDQYLSKVMDDVAQGRITFQQGLTALGDVFFTKDLSTPDFVSGLYGGKGWRLDHLGNMELESLRVRSFLEVVELLVNRLQAQEGDTIFSDNDQIERVDVVNNNGETSYILSLKEKWDGYFTSQKYNNVLKGIINTLAAKDAGVSDESQSSIEIDGVNKYYTSWMRVVETTATPNTTLRKNQIRVVLYGDNDVPAQRNFPPCQLMTIARWGCVDYSDPESPDYESVKADIIRRQRMFMISVSEGRVIKYTGVDSPILKNGNYGVTIGELPEFVKNYTKVRDVLNQVGEHTDWLYAQGAVLGNIIHIDKEGLPVPVIVDCGEWVDGSTIPTPTAGHGIYFYNKYNELTQQYEIHRVRHQSGTWQCLQNEPVINNNVATYHEPAWNSPYWRLVDGNSNLSIEFVSSRGYSFRRGAVDTNITAHLFYGNVDITNDVAAEYWNWTRTLDNPTQESTTRDATWNAQHQYSKTLHLTNDDMDILWASDNRQIFTLTVTVNDGETTVTVENQIIS